MRAAVALGMAVATLAIVAACGSDHPRAEVDSYVPPAPGKTLFSIDDAGSKPPGCGVKDDGTACECVDAPLFVNAPNIYFVLDSSGSMLEDDRWTQTRLTVANVMRSLGPRANFGAATFPGRTNDCSPGLEVLPITPGDPPSSTADGPAVQKLIAATAYTPSGGTPTSATLLSVAAHLQNVAGHTFVILATDGGPNCNGEAECTSSECQPNIEHFKNNNVDCVPDGAPNCCAAPYGIPENCNDGPATVSAVTALKNRGIPVYVVGLPGTEGSVYAQLLNQMAEAGGTAQTTGATKYFAVQRGSSEAIQIALKKIAAQITATCVFDLKDDPADPKLVNVYVDDVVLPQEPVNGWTLSGKSVTLVGAACDKVKRGDALSVRIIAGCPTVLPK